MMHLARQAPPGSIRTVNDVCFEVIVGFDEPDDNISLLLLSVSGVRIMEATTEALAMFVDEFERTC